MIFCHKILSDYNRRNEIERGGEKLLIALKQLSRLKNSRNGRRWFDKMNLLKEKKKKKSVLHTRRALGVPGARMSTTGERFLPL